MILALLTNSPKKHWNAFAFDTDIQSYVEGYMLAHFLSSHDYFLILESDLNNGRWVISLPLFVTHIHVEATALSIVYTYKVGEK